MTFPKVPKSGVWCPAITFFDRETDTLDLASQAKYYAYLAQTGLAGLVILGTNAETFLLTRDERAALVKCAREAVGPDFPLMVGCGGHSTAQVLEYIDDAVRCGGNYALVLPPAYFGKATTPAVIKSFYDDVAAKSAIPIVLYNFPGVCNGVDLDSEAIASIAQSSAHDGNVVGVKLTCGSVAKITRLTGVFGSAEEGKFAVFGGQSDFIVGGLSVGSAGCIAAFANVFPKTIVRIYDLYKKGEYAQALELHRKAALAESPCKAGIANTKYAAAIQTGKAAGIDGAVEKLLPRKPYQGPGEAAKEQIRLTMAEVAEIEAGL
ncbi:dihydrodipicolinate synthetase [Ascosphaera apis ARSEF 7405]|uniref:Dihydrodipicolinate synthetase n=1 Tax=Ascosphaera apis ARSEF 7405 TaxID=392613 RepID=A0A167YNC7_9EURO|nr:dihydrodipicolinate synthetase [Ascosphaera apis ARSEF 7405]